MGNEMESITRHYSPEALRERIFAALREEGKDPDGGLTFKDLAPVDQFHTHGLRATRELAEYGEINEGRNVIDVGSGLGGPARYLATALACRVTGIDLSPAFCEVATALSACCGLSEQTTFNEGNALNLDEPDNRFDLAWTVQVQMNIADKKRFYGEMLRVLRPGGRLVFQDICQGNGDPIDFPVPWASDASMSHLITPDDLRALLMDLGYTEVRMRDLRESLETNPPPPPAKDMTPLGIHLVMGETFVQKRGNVNAAFGSGRIEYVQGVFEKPA